MATVIGPLLTRDLCPTNLCLIRDLLNKRMGDLSLVEGIALVSLSEKPVC